MKKPNEFDAECVIGDRSGLKTKDSQALSAACIENWCGQKISEYLLKKLV
ncbi:MAG: hypothetical protein ACP5US_12625 [Candidatus Kryptoniota bacterium]